MTPPGRRPPYQRLDTRVTVERAAVTAGPLGPVTAWATVGTVLAERLDLRGQEGDGGAEGEARIARIETVFRVRWSTFSAGITASDRLVAEGRRYDIHAVRNLGRRELREIVAMARAE